MMQSIQQLWLPKVFDRRTKRKADNSKRKFSIGHRCRTQGTEQLRLSTQIINLFVPILIHRLLLFLQYFVYINCSCSSSNDFDLAATNNLDGVWTVWSRSSVGRVPIKENNQILSAIVNQSITTRAYKNLGSISIWLVAWTLQRRLFRCVDQAADVVWFSAYFQTSTAPAAARQLQNILPGCMRGYQGSVQFSTDQAPMRHDKHSHPTNQTYMSSRPINAS